ncbi:MAG: hypothetical protein ACXU8N_14765 [Telluria sp.]
MHTYRLAAATAFAFAAACAQAQTPATPAPAAAPAAAAPAAAPAKTYAARPADVQSVDSIVAALYDVISGPVGQARDFDRMRSLFAPEGRMAAVVCKPEGNCLFRHMTVEDYIARNGKLLVEHGFFESEKARTAEVFGQIAHVFSTYEAREKSKDAPPFMRGINSIQLYNDGSRWWIVSVFWRAEDRNLKLPERYLQSH